MMIMILSIILWFIGFVFFPRVALWVVFVQSVLKPDSNLEVVIFTLVAVFIFAVDVLFLCLLEDKN
ncbi:MAG: hypothetical protein ACRC1T_09460 [Clostridium chrysemydis]|uniref:hypothetical protein n=1 Tax=Clostridium chrysemydis TaxID=2665504 RepID=UPI003F2BA55E